MTKNQLAWVETPAFEKLTMGVIVANAAILTAETMTTPGSALNILKWADKACLFYFLAEIMLRIAVNFTAGRGLKHFFSQGWNMFDVVATLAALLPGLGALRTLRLLRLVARVPAFRDTVEDLLFACKRSLQLLMLMMFLLFLGALTGSLGFAETMPKYFGSFGTSFITAFGLMLSDNISEKIREMAAVNWSLAIFFMIYTALMAILILALVVSVVIEASQIRRNAREKA